MHDDVLQVNHAGFCCVIHYYSGYSIAIRFFFWIMNYFTTYAVVLNIYTHFLLLLERLQQFCFGSGSISLSMQ